MKKIELLSPAKDYNSGVAAINSGADAVYIGASKYGAREIASNSIEDIEKLVKYAHKYYCKIYTTVNTILYDKELGDANKLIKSLYEIGVDAIIIQDMGILEMDLPPIPLFASTQTHNYSIEKINFLEKVGFQRAILARELTIDKIKEIRENTNIELETFIHGSLCVGFSGQCYLSHSFGKRSGNRGQCAQPCRLKYNLENSKGKILIENKHILSLKDLNLSKYIFDLIDVGINSFKIEGRLKDSAYVKNITSYYRILIDNILNKKEDFKKSSSGNAISNFNPDIYKTFNRGYTSFFISGREKNISSMDTPKSKGRFIGKVTDVYRDHFVLDSKADLINGDGLCFFNTDGDLEGFYVNRVTGDKIFPNEMKEIYSGADIFKNFDFRFLKELEANACVRKIDVNIDISVINNIFLAVATDEDNNKVNLEIEINGEVAKNIEKLRETIDNQFRKCGDTIFQISNINIEIKDSVFITISQINDFRRQIIELLLSERIKNLQSNKQEHLPNNYPYPFEKLDYKANISNKLAEKFYQRHGVKSIEEALELQDNITDKEVMTTKYCIKYELGFCSKYDKNAKKDNNVLKETLYLKTGKHLLELDFNCSRCEMNIIYKK